MSEPFYAEIKMWGCNFAPRDWADCNGQLIQISENTALFSLLGTVYGGDGRSTFGLPNLKDSAAMHAGQGPGLSYQPLGAKSGTETATLSANQLPVHNHNINVNTDNASVDLGVGKILSKGYKPDGFPATRPIKEYADYDAAKTVAMAANMLSSTGGSAAHANMQPYLAVRFCMALQGIYPSRN